MNRYALMVALCLFAPSLAIAEDSVEELDFLDMEQGEKNRKAREADRAPSSEIFLDEEEDTPDWELPAASRVLDDEGDDPDEDLDSTGLGTAQFGDEDIDGDPIDDLSPTERLSIMEPLEDNFPLTLVATGNAHVTVELPIIVAQGATDFEGEAYWVVAELWVNGNAISEGRHLVTENSIADSGPSKVWFKLEAPAEGPEAQVEVRVFQQGVRSTRAQPLFSRSLSIRM